MSVTVAIPTPLRNFTGGRDAIDVSGTTVGEVLDGLLTAHAWPWYSYLIVRIDRGRGAELASWMLDDAQPVMHPESLDVLSEV